MTPKIDILNAQNQTGNWRLNPSWLAIKGISLQECINGSDRIEKLTPLFDKKPSLSPKVGFGKHANLTFQELYEQEPRYFEWARENIKGFEQKVIKFVDFNNKNKI